MSKNQAPPYSLRMPDELRSRIEERAKENKRSLNAEIIALLESATSPTGSTSNVSKDFFETMREVNNQFEELRTIREKVEAMTKLLNKNIKH